MEPKRKRISVAQVPKKKFTHQSALELLATLCYYYPQYTFQAARQLPYKRVVLLVKTAQKMEAMKYFNLTQIVAAPHTKNGKGVQTLVDEFKSRAEL